ncbi:MAG: class I SAM-dependent methyltransferase [Bacteroidales bacterium]|nr:class I SAM-dependent methyltransferase [Bacteroidales bacterium]
MTLKDFINKYEGADPERLLLSKSTEWPDQPEKDVAIYTLEGRKKIRAKVPSWYENQDIIYPTRLCTEQCSSEFTAAYKAELLQRILRFRPGTIADLTSGLGVDVAAFNQVASKVLYNDMNPALVEAAKHNFGALGIENVEFSNVAVDENTVGEILKDGWDIVFLDPARRDDQGRKVFLIEDCQPDVLKLLPIIYRYAKNVVLKLSPMADITMVAERLGNVRSIHVVASAGECKELLVHLDRDYVGEYELVLNEDGEICHIYKNAEKDSKAQIASTTEDLENKILFEPGKSLAKAGLFNWTSERFKLIKAGVNTHIYFGYEPVHLGKNYRIEKVLPLDKQGLKTAGKEYPDADVTAKNIPLTSDALRAKLGIKKSNNTGLHIFGLHFDCSKQNILLICRKVQY